jgi:transposase-like protein
MEPHGGLQGEAGVGRHQGSQTLAEQIGVQNNQITHWRCLFQEGASAKR